MNLFDISAILITAAAVSSFINERWIKLPSSIGLLLLALTIGLLGIFFEKIGFISNDFIEKFLSHINFQETVFHGMLSFLLFAGALQIDIEDLKSTKIPIAITATVSTFISTIIICFIFFYITQYLGFVQVTLLHAMLFGAILSPTDPIAVLAIIKKIGAPKDLETTIIGESLFNDCVALVFFLFILKLLSSNGDAQPSDVIKFLSFEVGGGILFGLIIGWIAYQMLSRIENYYVELLITLAVATGGYTAAETLTFSAPLAMVVAGIIIGNHRRSVMTEQSRKHIELFWEMTDEILNAVLFFLIGLEMMVIHASFSILLLGTICILIALSARLISIAIPLHLMKKIYRAKKGTIILLTWGGLRGALSIAMVLSLQEVMIKDLFLPCIYLVVIFSIAVQGLSFGKVLKRYEI